MQDVVAACDLGIALGGGGGGGGGSEFEFRLKIICGLYRSLCHKCDATSYNEIKCRVSCAEEFERYRVKKSVKATGVEFNISQAILFNYADIANIST